MYEELDNVVRIFNSLEKKAERMVENQANLGKKVDGSIKNSQNFLDKMTVKKHKKKKSHK
jgi:hypothetical protein